jgi:hypothetical protein
MYIDLTFPIRAIYFPLAQKPSKVFPDLCSYLMVDFRLRQGVQMWNQPTAGLDNKDTVEEDPDIDPEDIVFPGGDPFRDHPSHVKRIPMEFDLYAGLGLRPDCKSTSFPGLILSEIPPALNHSHFMVDQTAC